MRFQVSFSHTRGVSARSEIARSVVDALHAAIDGGTTLLLALEAEIDGARQLEPADISALLAHEAHAFGGISDLAALPRCASPSLRLLSIAGALWPCR